MPQPPTPTVSALTVSIPALPPSVNHLYKTVRRRNKQGRMVPLKFLTSAAEAWYGLAVPLIRQAAADGWTVPEGELVVRVELYGLPGNADIDNTLKGCLDAAAQALGFNDSRVCDLRVRRAGPKPRRTIITLEGA